MNKKCPVCKSCTKELFFKMNQQTYYWCSLCRKLYTPNLDECKDLLLNRVALKTFGGKLP